VPSPFPKLCPGGLSHCSQVIWNSLALTGLEIHPFFAEKKNIPNYKAVFGCFAPPGWWCGKAGMLPFAFGKINLQHLRKSR